MSLLVDSSFNAYWVTLQVQAWKYVLKAATGISYCPQKKKKSLATHRPPDNHTSHFMPPKMCLWLTGPPLGLWAKGLLNKTLLWEVLCSPGYGRSDISVVQDNASLPFPPHKNRHAHKWAAPLVPLAKALDDLVEAGSFATVESPSYAPWKFSAPPPSPAEPWKRWVGSPVQIKSQIDSIVGMGV